MGLGPVEVHAPRVADVPFEVAPHGFQSQIIRRYQRASEGTRRLFARLYLEGLATGDFEPVFRELVGETMALSPNAIVRLKECWEKEYTDWRKRPLWGHRYLYIGGSAGILGHLQIADHVEIAAFTLIGKSIREAGSYAAIFPFAKTEDWRRNSVHLRHLDELAGRIRKLEQQLKSLSAESLKPES